LKSEDSKRFDLGIPAQHRAPMLNSGDAPGAHPNFFRLFLPQVISLFCITLFSIPLLLAGSQNAQTPTASTGGQKSQSEAAPAGPSEALQQKPKASVGPAEDESDALDEAISSAQRDPQALIKNLKSFLLKFPQSPRREQVLRTIFREALQANDPGTATAYAEKLLEAHPDDPALLASLVDLLDRESDAASRAQAIVYGTRFIDHAEKMAKGTKPADVTAEHWQESMALMLATGYSMRGKVYAKGGDDLKSLADYEKSYAAYPTSQVAERIGDLASKGGDVDRALDEYATAFAFPEKSSDPAHRSELRKKLGSAYVAKYQSEKGLGELILARYDQLSHSLMSRFESGAKPNADIRDPYQFVLQRLDGSPLRMADYQGRVVVIDFWATWCGPCRLQGRILERVVESFRNEPAASFLAANVDEDRDGVPGFIREEKWKIPVAYAQGLDHLLQVSALPTLVIFDRNGRIVFREEGMDPATFEQQLVSRLREILARQTAAGRAPSR